MSTQAFDDSQYESYESGMGALSTLGSWIGAGLSFVLVIGLGVWSYNLTMREVTDVPVVRAMVGPYRVQPGDPGGETAAHQGLAVNQVQSSGSVEDPANRVVLAPDPLQLTDEDVAEVILKSKNDTIDSDTLTIDDVSASELTDKELIAAALEAAVNEAEISDETRQMAKLPGVKRSPRPKARSLRVAAVDVANDAGTGQTATDVPTTPRVSAIDVDPALVVPGTKMVQLGAFDDRESAAAEWDQIIARHGDLIGGHKRFIQEAESGGRPFFRLRMVGFVNLSDSRRLCSALLARGTPCIPVTAR